jgi:hypothetical protein
LVILNLLLILAVQYQIVKKVLNGVITKLLLIELRMVTITVSLAVQLGNGGQVLLRRFITSMMDIFGAMSVLTGVFYTILVLTPVG